MEKIGIEYRSDPARGVPGAASRETGAGRGALRDCRAAPPGATIAHPAAAKREGRGSRTFPVFQGQNTPTGFNRGG